MNPRNATSQDADLHSCALPASQTATDAAARDSSSSSDRPLSGNLPTSTIWVTSTSGNYRGSDTDRSFTKTALPTITITTVVTADAAAKSTPSSESRAEPGTTSTARASPSSVQDGKPPREPPPPSPSLTSSQTSRPSGGAASTAAPDAMLTDGTATARLFVVDVGFTPSDHRATPADQPVFHPQSLDVRPGDSVLFRLHGPYALYLSNEASPCHASRLSQNSVSRGKDVSSHQFSVQSNETAWFSASLVDRPQDCNNHTVFVLN